jgi:hypothetical protein
VVPRSRHLLQAVEGLVEPAHQLRVRGVNETDGLRAVDDRASAGANPWRESESAQFGRWQDDGAEGLVIVHPDALIEPSKDPTSLVPVKRNIRPELMLEDPLTGDDIGPMRPSNQIPCVVRQQGLVLIHSATPVGVRERTTDRG